MPNAVLAAEHAELAWVNVTSSNLERVAYVPGVGRLWIQFVRKPGSKYTTYAYDYVEPSVYQALLNAPSKGGYFARHIKPVYAVTPFS